MFEKCTYCGERTFIMTVRDEHGTFCHEECRALHLHGGFCENCLKMSIPSSIDNLTRINGYGQRLFTLGLELPRRIYLFRCPSCSTCGSSLRYLYYCLFFVPVFPMGEYLSFRVGSRRFITRKFTPTDIEPVTPN